MNERTSNLTKTIIIFSSLAISILFCELTLRLADYKPPLLYSFYLIDNGNYRNTNKDLIVLPPNLEIEKLVESDHDRNEVQVVALGDSFTQGIPGPVSESYPKVLENFMKDQNSSLRVINAGWGHSGPDQHFRYFKDYLLPNFQPSLVIWSLYANDIWDNALIPTYDISQNGELVELDGRFHWIYLRQVFYKLFPLPNSIKTNSYVFNLLLKSFELYETSKIPVDSELANIEWGLSKIKIELNEMENLSRDLDFSLLFVLIAPESEYLSGLNPGKFWNSAYWANVANKKLMEELDKHNNFLYVLFDPIKTKPIDIPEAYSGISYTGLNIFTNANTEPEMEPGYFHFNKKGYRLMAEMICKKIDRDLDYPCKVN